MAPDTPSGPPGSPTGSPNPPPGSNNSDTKPRNPLRDNAKVAEVSRRTLMGAVGIGAVAATIGAWPRLTGSDIPGRGSKGLSIAILGTAADAEARQGLVDEFNRLHPDIPVKIQAIQGADWRDFFTKILTMLAAGAPPDIVYVATEGTQLFAERLAYPLDEFVTRDAAQIQEYFDDVHPSLVESMMYQGSLYQLPIDWNAANIYLNSSALERAGLSRPDANWSKEDFSATLRAMQQEHGGGFTPYYWTNRLFGGVVPWLYANDTSILTESKWDGGNWFWNQFYANDTTSRNRSGGPKWLHAKADDQRVLETYEYLHSLVSEDLSVRPSTGGGNALVGLFSSGKIGTTPAGGYWAQGLHEAGMEADGFAVQYFPRWRTQRHSFGAAGYAIMRTAKDKDAAWEWVKFCASKPAMEIAIPSPTTTPARRSMVNEALYAQTGPDHWKVFYNTLDKFPDSGPIPAPPQTAEVQSALIKNTSLALGGGPKGVRPALSKLQKDLEQALRSTV
ncbi:hypothetical protein GCM10027562_14240 [Arthrobacter pigmenti]